MTLCGAPSVSVSRPPPREIKGGRTPGSAVHRALLFRRGGAEPFEETVHVEDVAAFAPDWGVRTDSAQAQHKRHKDTGTGRHALNGQSSPGILHDGQHPSYGTRQIPHTSSSSSFWSADPVFQRHCATALQCLMCTFMTEAGARAG